MGRAVQGVVCTSNVWCVWSVGCVVYVMCNIWCEYWGMLVLCGYVPCVLDGCMGMHDVCVIFDLYVCFMLCVCVLWYVSDECDGVFILTCVVCCSWWMNYV